MTKGSPGPAFVCAERRLVYAFCAYVSIFDTDQAEEGPWSLTGAVLPSMDFWAHFHQKANR